MSSLRASRAFRRLFFPVLLSTLAIAQQPGHPGEHSAFRALPNHVPQWANESNSLGAVPAEEPMAPMTLVLQRSAGRERAFEKLLAEQQDPASPEYHHWLTPSQIGERFGLAQDDLDSIKSWLESENLHVDFVAPTHDLIGFHGAAGDISRAFQTEIDYYGIEGERRVANVSDPMLPSDLATKVRSIHGLYTIKNRPLSFAQPGGTVSPLLTNAPGYNLVTPADFARIYDQPATYNGKGITVGIVGRAHTNFADFKGFQYLTKTSFANPIEIVPTAYGGVDPGPAYTSPPASQSVIGDQLEATLDVQRVGSVAQGARILLVVNKSLQDGGSDIGGDAEYLIESEPVPVQVMSISFGECESDAGSSGVDFWDHLFQTAVGEGISVYVASGDSGAAGCDPYNAAPPSAAEQKPNSPNYICSSSYATCVGGTEFNDASDYSRYWSGSNGAGLESALTYIPEGAWNEPVSSSNTAQVSATGGGVSLIIPTPVWQKGTGVPAARTGRYTPDVSFSSAGHDAYLGCMAAIKFSDGVSPACTDVSGYYYFGGFFGTSAAAPGMAGVTALLDQKLGGKGQGNLAPSLYSLVAKHPVVFHDVTVASSGVSSCNVNKPSICNNSSASNVGSFEVQPGFLVGTGFDEATGLGSLDIANFLSSFGAAPVPIVTTGVAAGVLARKATLEGTVNPEGAATEYWFAYGASATLAGAAATSKVSAGSGSAVVDVHAAIGSLTPGKKYYFALKASDSGGVSTGAIHFFATEKATQTIDFNQPTSPLKYGAKLTLRATASSGLPVTFKIVSGPGKISGSQLTVTGVGTIVVGAIQPGNASYLPAAEVKRSILAQKASLTVTAR